MRTTTEEPQFESLRAGRSVAEIIGCYGYLRSTVSCSRRSNTKERVKRTSAVVSSEGARIFFEKEERERTLRTCSDECGETIDGHICFKRKTAYRIRWTCSGLKSSDP